MKAARWRSLAWQIGRWTAAGLALLGVLVALILLLGNTNIGRRGIEGLTARLTHGHVQLRGLEGSFPTDLALDSLRLADSQGVWLSAQHIQLRWSPLALLRHRIRVDTLQLSRLEVERLPVSSPQTQKTGQSQLPRIDVRQLHVGTLELGPALAGERITLTVGGRAHLISIEDARAQLLAQRVDGTGRYALNLRFDPRRMDAQLEVDEPAGGPLQHLAQLPGLGEVSLRASLAGPRNAEQLALTLHAATLQGKANGTLDLIHRSADLDYALQGGAMSPRPHLAWQRVDIQGTVRGPWSAPLAKGHAFIEQLQLPGGAALEELRAQLEGESGVLRAQMRGEGVVIPGAQPRLLADAPVVVDAVIRLNEAQRPLQLNAHHPLIALQARAVTAGALSARLQARLSDLAPFAEMAHLHLSGPGTLDADLARRGPETRLNATLRADVAGRNGELPDWGQLLGKGAQLQVKGTLTDHALTLDSLRLRGAAASFTGSGSGVRAAGAGGPLARLDAKGELAVSKLAAVSSAVAGRLRATVKISGPRRSMAAQVQASTSLSVRGSPENDLEVKLSARDLPSSPAGSIDALGSLDGAPLTLHARLDRDGSGAFHLRINHTDWKSLHADGELRSAARSARAQGQVQLRVDHLEDLQRLAGVPLRGRIRAQASLMSEGTQTHAQLRVAAQDIQAAGVQGDGELSATGPMDALPMHLSVQLAQLAGSPVHLDATGELRMPQQELALLTARGTYHDEPITLASPALIRFNEGLTVSDLRLSAQKAHLAFQGRLTPRLDMRADLSDVDADLVNAFHPKLLSQGSLSAQVQLSGSPVAPQGRAQVKVTGLRLANPSAQNLPPVEAQGTAVMRGDGLALVDARLAAGSGSLLSLKGQVPLQEERPGLNLTLSGKADLALMNPMLEAHGRHAAGLMSVNAHITGPRQAPEMQGTMELAQGDLRDYNQGVHLSHISGKMTGHDGELEITSLTARAATGDVKVTGTMAVLRPGLPVDLHLSARKAQPLASDILTANLDADLDLKGTLEDRVTLSGTIHVNRADIGIPNSLPPDVAVLDVRRPGEAPAAAPERPLVVALDLRLQAPRQILVTGRGLDAELGGNLHIQGTKDMPEVTGGFDLIRGSLSLASTPLTFTAGRVSFNGAGLRGRLDPTLDFTAQTSVAETTATLRVTGLADAPQFQLSSTPQDLPQDEILARLLFGQSASTLSASQLVTMGSALATVSGVGSGVNPLVKVQKSLGLDRLTVSGGSPGVTSTTQNTGATVEAGRYVASNVFVAARQSTTGVTQLVVDVDLTRRLKVRTRLGNGSTTAQGVTPENDPGSSVGVSYQFEY